MGSAASIVADRLGHAYGTRTLRRQVLSEVCAEVRAGEVVIVRGPSGSGKTTFLSLVGCLRSPQQGSLRVLGRELSGADERTRAAVRRGIGFVFQDHRLIDSLNAGQNVQMALDLRRDGRSRRELRHRAEQMLDAVGLGGRGDAAPRELSGGERQRVSVARALAADPRIVLADEPTASLDSATGRGVVELIRDFARERSVAVLIVTHDHRVLDVADRILELEDGRLRAAASERAAIAA